MSVPDLQGQEAVGSVIARLKSCGWVHVELGREVDDAEVPLGGTPGDYVTFLSAFSVLSSPDDDTWFLAVEDFSGIGASDFAWDEFRAISLEAAETREDVEAVASFWRTHLPICMSVRDGYAFLALAIESGAVVMGMEPEFEQVEHVAADLKELLVRLAHGVDVGGFFGLAATVPSPEISVNSGSSVVAEQERQRR